MNNTNMAKAVRFDTRAVKEIRKFPSIAQIKINATIAVLSKYGYLSEPLAKKLNKDLYEIRIKSGGQYRILYAYIIENQIIILSAFLKKTPKTPPEELKKAINRYKEYSV